MLNQNIVKLGLEFDLLQKLQSNKIYIVHDLWKLTRTDLKKFGLNDNEINQIVIKMQLQGIDLNRKVYKQL